MLSRVRAAIQEWVTAPFHLSIDTSARLTPEDQEAQRRYTFFRLIIGLLTLLELFVGLPLALLARVPQSVVLVQLTGVGLGVGCLILAQRGRTTLGGLLFLMAAVLGLFLGTAFDPQVRPLRAVLAFSLQSVFILLASLTLPLRYLGGVVLFIVSVLVFCLWGIAPHLFTDTDKGLILGFLSVIYLTTAGLAWVAARSSLAGLAAVTRALRREQELAKLKDLFIDDINHELRTPIMAMVTNYEMLAAAEARGTAAVRQRMISRGLQAGRQIMALLRSILDSAVVDAQASIPLQWQVISVREAVQEALRTFDPNEIGEAWLDQAAIGREVQVQVAPELVVWANGIRLRQILVNLVANALKYSPSDSPITIWARAAGTAMGGVELGIAD